MMSEEEQNTQGGVQANNNSTAVGKIEVGGSIGGDMVIGGTHNYYASPADAKSPLTTEKIEREFFEPETILIPDGPLWMGSDSGEGINKEYDTPRHEVFLPAFRIGKYPVANAQYEEFIRQTGKFVTPVMGWDGQKVPNGLESNPVMGITWYDALAYCKWLSDMTKRKYSIPNAAQLEKAYQGSYGCSDIIDNIHQWTCTLWGEKRKSPDLKYRLPWKDDGRNNLNANSQIRRIVCVYTKMNDNDSRRLCSRTGQFPEDVGLPGARHSFRVVMSI